MLIYDSLEIDLLHFYKYFGFKVNFITFLKLKFKAKLTFCGRSVQGDSLDQKVGKLFLHDVWSRRF